MRGAKRKGTRREHQSRELLEREGFRVIRAAGSLGAFDLAAFSPDAVVLVQCKSRDWPSSAELSALRAFPCPPGTRREIHRWKDRCSAPDIREVA